MDDHGPGATCGDRDFDARVICDQCRDKEMFSRAKAQREILLLNETHWFRTETGEDLTRVSMTKKLC